MTRNMTLVAFSLVLAAASGCIPEKRIAWSPDGQVAAVMTDDAIRFIDGDGKVLSPQLRLIDPRCEWFPDGRRLLVRHDLPATKWDDVGALFDEPQTARIKSEAQKLRERILGYQGDWDAFKFEPEEDLPPGMVVAIFFYLRDRLPDGLPEKLGAKWEDARKLETPVRHLQIFTFDKTAVSPGPVLLRTLDPVGGLRTSPTGRNVSFLMQTSSRSNQSPTLYVMPTDSGSPRVVAANVAVHYDWSPDGRSLAYIRSNDPPAEGEGIVRLGTLTTITVANAGGELLSSWLDRNDRVGLLFNDQLMVRWLSDERLFFTSVQVSLPATTRDMPQQWSLFALDPRMPASVIRVLGRDFDQSLLGSPLFFLSPDEKRVVLSGPNNRLTLYDIAAAQGQPIAQPEEESKTARPLPSWRNNSEICFVAPGKPAKGTASRAEIFLWKDGGVRSLSAAWPDEMRGQWMGDSNPTSQPMIDAPQQAR